uniref:ATP synthase epsilon chain n=1 Tax=Acidobacterium capsulatum TaxID=33075 RepID=A0A7V5CTU7_9BACT
MAEKKQIQVRLVTPDRILLDVMADAVEVPSKAGYFEAIHGHAPVLAQLWPGEVKVHGATGEGAGQRFLVARGFAEVLPERVTILAEVATTPDKVNHTAAEELKQHGEELWQQAGDDASKYDAALESIAEAEMLLGSHAHHE